MTHLSAKTWLCFCVCSAAVRAPGQQPATAPANPAAPASAPAASVPHMKLSTMNWDFGSIWDTEKSQFTLKVTNDGTGELRFEAKPSCGCISVQVIKRTIPPGQSADMQVTFDPKGKQGKTEQTIEFTSNDPAFASYQFTIGGTVKRAVDDGAVRRHLDAHCQQRSGPDAARRAFEERNVRADEADADRQHRQGLAGC